jgi:NAD(P)-dependent dehydrogenase (short-subunit alcohol dehydrogenase family)
MDLGLADRKVIVTGGAAGIGRCIATSFHSYGARVTVCDVDSGALQTLAAQRTTIRTYTVDIAEPDAVKSFINDAARFMGGIDVLVNNVGIQGPTAFTEELPIDEWQRTLAVNVSGPFYCARYAIPHLKAAHGASIINISSAAVRKGGFPLRLPYAVSKRGVIALTETLAMELGRFGIRVNSVLPGSVDNGRLQRVLEEQSRRLGRTKEQILEAGLAQTSMRVIVEEQDVANLVLFLASDCARHISGQEISVCGNFEGHRTEFLGAAQASD